MIRHGARTTASAKLAEFAAALRWADVPTAVREKLKTTLLHNIAMALAGRALSDVAVAVATSTGASPVGEGPRILVDGTRVRADDAILANAAMMHARTQDDTHLAAQTHLGATTLPALLAVGEEIDAAGESLLLAMLAAYEVAAVGIDLASTATARGFRPSTAFGQPAAAIGAARLYGADATVIRNAIGLAAAFGAGTGQTWVAGTDEWQYQVGVAGRNGLLAARLAARGVAGAPDSLEGAAGLLAAVAGETTTSTRLDRLGEEWSILEVTYKPYPVCVINQRPVELAVRMRESARMDVDAIDEVRLTLPPVHAEYPGTDAYAPFSGVGAALMSAPHCLALALRTGTVRRHDLENHEDPAVVALSRRIVVIADPDMAVGACRLEIFTGGTMHSSDDVADPGPFDWPFDEVYRRAEQLGTELALPPERLAALAELISDLENRSVRDLMTATIR